MNKRSPITTHILDTSLGKPAANVKVRLFKTGGDGKHDQLLAEGFTNEDGRVEDLLPPYTAIAAGSYRLVFETAAYLSNRPGGVFFPRVAIDFFVDAPTEHYHVPLLLSPYSYATYRGS